MIKYGKIAVLVGVVGTLMTVGSAKAVLWGDTVESKIDIIDGVVVSNDSMLDVMDSKLDIIDSELSVLDATINNGTTYLTSADIVGGNIDLAIGGNYTLAEVLTTDVTITAGCVTLDLNDLCLTGTILISSDNATIKNGTLLPPEGGSGGGGISVVSASDRTRISNLTIQGENATGDTPGKDGIEIAGNDWIVENCTIITGNGNGNLSNGGHGISLFAAANNVLIRNCLISTGAGGGAEVGGNGGNGINVNGSTDVEIADCTIFKTGAGGAGDVTNGNGGHGIFIASTATDISVHNCIIRNTGAAGGGGGTAGSGGEAIDDDVAAGAAVSIIFGNFAHNIANAIRFDLQASGGEDGFSLSNPPSSTAVSVYANVYI